MCISYITRCLANPDVCKLAKAQLLRWLTHMCSRPDVLAEEVSLVVDELTNIVRSASSSLQDFMLEYSQCLAGLTYQCTV